MHRSVRTRLSAMMFLVYFSLGSWAVTSGTYLMSSPPRGGLNFTTAQVGWIYSTFAIGAMLATPLVGILVDRLFRADRVFAVAATACGLSLLGATIWCERSFPEIEAEYAAQMRNEVVDGASLVDHPHRRDADPPDGVKEAFDRINNSPEMRGAASRAFLPLFAIMLFQSFCLLIALTLTTVLSLRNLPDPGHQFARTRMFGTVGWVAAGLLMGAILQPISAEPFLLSAAAMLLVGAYGFTLPRTPPKGTGKSLGEAFGLPAFKLFRDRSFVVFILVALLTTQMNQFYGVYGHRFLTDLGLARPERWMTIGQIIEIGCMFALPLLNPKRNMKWLMLLGVVASALRAAAMIGGETAIVLAVGVPMHGLNFALYFVVAATFIDREAPPTLRASAQAIAAFVSSGLGPWTGNLMASAVVDHYRIGRTIDWPAVWIVPLFGSGTAALIFLIFFRTPTKPAVHSGA
jgi:MFS family permease